jgi:hypothetical protein
MSIYRTMWLDGRLLREAATCRTAAELAQRLGVSEEGLKRSLYTMRQAGEAVPLLKDLLGRPEREDLAGFGQQRPAVFPIGKDEPPFLYPDPTAGEGEDWEDERTSPGMTVPEIIGKADIGIEKSMEPIHMEQDVPEGFRVKGTSTYYDAAGKVIGQWVKTSASMRTGSRRSLRQSRRSRRRSKAWPRQSLNRGTPRQICCASTPWATHTSACTRGRRRRETRST